MANSSRLLRTDRKTGASEADVKVHRHVGSAS
jgi:hypothetical protein